MSLPEAEALLEHIGQLLGRELEAVTPWRQTLARLDVEDLLARAARADAAARHLNFLSAQLERLLRALGADERALVEPRLQDIRRDAETLRAANAVHAQLVKDAREIVARLAPAARTNSTVYGPRTGDVSPPPRRSERA